MTTLQFLLAVAAVTVSISYTICQSSIFLWLRDLIDPIHPKLSQLINCPYCFSHYVVATILIVVYISGNIPNMFIPITNWMLFDAVFTWFAILGMVAFIHYFVMNAYGGRAGAFFRAKMLAQKKVQKNQE